MLTLPCRHENSLFRAKLFKSLNLIGPCTDSNPLDAMGISKQNLMYNILTPSIIAIYKFLWTYGGPRHIRANSRRFRTIILAHAQWYTYWAESPVVCEGAG